MISKRTCRLFEREQSNFCLRIIPRRESAGLQTDAIINPKETKRTKIYSLSCDQTSSFAWDKHGINKIWHRRMGHANEATIADMIKKPSYCMKTNIRSKKLNCETCVQTKGTKQTATGRLTENSQTLTIHTDVCGLFKQDTFGSKQLFLTFIVTPHRYMHVSFIKICDEELVHCYHLICWVESGTDQKGRRVYSDNVCEFMAMKQDMQKKDILLTTYAPYSPLSNGLTEIMDRIIMVKVRAMMKDARMP